MTSPRLRLVHDRPDTAAHDGDDDDLDDADSGADGFGAHRVIDLDAREAEAAAAAAEEAEARARRARAQRLGVAGGIAFQCLAVLHDAPHDIGYAVAGAVAPPAILAYPGCLMLYAAAIGLARGRARAGTRVLFLVAAATLAFAVPFWGLASPVTWPFELGATLALAGAWLVNRDRGRGLLLAGGTAAPDGRLP